MKCRICASECPPGSKLCRDCAAARKRAFAATVTQPLLAAAGASSIGHRFAPRPKARLARRPSASAAARSEAAIAASAADAKPAPRRRGLLWLWFGLAIAAVVVYLLIRVLSGNHAESGETAPPGDGASSVATPVSSTPGSAPSPVPAVDPLHAAAVSASAAAKPPDAGDAGAESKNAAPKPHLRKPAPKPEPPSALAPAPAPKAEPAPAPRAAPPPVAEPVRDPWQAMNEGLSRCAREDWSGRASCEQRLRLQYCPEHWGLVPQCPIGPTDHGS
jgi:hypothetical protein